MRLSSKNLYKKYGSRTVVKDVSLYVDRGEIVGLLGPNGACKTTSFYFTVGFNNHNPANVFLADGDVPHLPMYLSP